MKNIFILIFSLLTISAWAESHRHIGESVPTYQIMSDKFDSSIPEGKVLIKGLTYTTVYRGNENDTIPIVHGKISNLGQTTSCLSSETGRYEFTITEADSVIYFYKYTYEEVVISPYNFKSQHVVTIDFFPRYQQDGFSIPTEKPVIYVYSDESTNVKIGVDQIGEMTFTYPKLDSTWNFTAGKDGSLIMKNGTTHPYLFWEADRDLGGFQRNQYVIPGEIIEKERIVTFLEKSLTSLGLNDREKTDFITYWGPRMQANESSFVQFTIDNNVAPVIGSLNISPKPNSIRRVFVQFIDADKFNLYSIYVIEKQTFSSFERKGLTVVEWGGSELVNTLLDEN
jgi:hypothetical protein